MSVDRVFGESIIGIVTNEAIIDIEFVIWRTAPLTEITDGLIEPWQGRSKTTRE